MNELGYTEETVEYVQYDAGGNISTLHTILNSVEGKGFDLLVTLVTSVTQAAVSKELSTRLLQRVRPQLRAHLLQRVHLRARLP